MLPSLGEAGEIAPFSHKVAKKASDWMTRPTKKRQFKTRNKKYVIAEKENSLPLINVMTPNATQ